MSKTNNNNTGFADLLREACESVKGNNSISFQVKEIKEKCKKAALSGKNHIKIRCSERDFEGVAYPLAIKKTELVSLLLEEGLTLFAEMEMPFWSFSLKYTLTISW